ncbi:MAG TPA: ATP-binding protein [Methylomirabilota bacterium]|jgi:PAS domain S-box-containing protein|nr:ATP-binding protein [Methylomirabilota bacterium]
MRFGIRSKDAVAVTLLTFLVVATTTMVHISQLTRVVVQEASGQAQLVAKQIYAQIGQALTRAPGRPPLEALRRDRELRNLLEASVGYSPHLVYAFVSDGGGAALLDTRRDREGAPALQPGRLDDLLGLGTIRRFSALYRSGETYETVLPMNLNGQPFASIHLGVSTTLLRKELNASVGRSLALAGITLPVAWLAAMALAQLTLRPLRALGGELDRLRRGEFDVGTSLGGGNEFQELSSQLQQLGQEMQADRTATLSEKAQLEHIVDQLEDGVIFLNTDQRILFFNRAAAAAVGRPLEQVVGLPLTEVLPDDHPLCELMAENGMGTAAPHNRTLAFPQDGSTREFLVSIVAMRDKNRAMGAAILMKDLDSIKTVQSLVSYSAKLAALGRLTSGVAHEVKNPLNAMMIHLELLKERLEAPTAEVQQSLEVIGSEIHRLDRVVQGFLRFMRPQELVLKTIDMNGLLRNLTALIEAEWQGEGIRIACELDPTLPPVGADEELLRQAFLNVLQNASQAMPKGGTVTMRTTCEGRDVVRVDIADEGVGIARDDLERIFKLYYTTKPEGTGIGLSVAYRIVQLHDGVIDVDSELGRGTTMTIRLPAR